MDTSRARCYYNSAVMGYHVYQDIWEPTNEKFYHALENRKMVSTALLSALRRMLSKLAMYPEQLLLFVQCFYKIMARFSARLQGQEGIPEASHKVDCCRFLLEGTKHYVGMASKKLEKVEKLATAKNETARGSQEKSDPEATTKVIQKQLPKLWISGLIV